jgi:glycerophosphoryl diester phosphodiesterase
VTTFLDGPTPRAFAHRGWHTGDLAGCENSLAAFTRAVAEGYIYLETDVHTTSDGVLVAFHDHVLDRVTDATGPVSATSFADLRRARIGGRERIPTMAEVLEACPGARFNVDPKSNAAVGPLIDLLSDAGLVDRVCVGAFSDARIAALRGALGPGLATSLGPREVGRLTIASALNRRAPRTPAVAAQVPVRYGAVRVVTRRFLDTAHRAGLEVHVWTIDDPAEMGRLLDMGVDAIMTDRPDLLRDVLVARGAWSE